MPGLRSTSVAIRQPKESARSLAPTTATVRPSSMRRSRGRTGREPLWVIAVTRSVRACVA